MWEPEEPDWLPEQWVHPDEPWDDSACGPEYWMYRNFGLPPSDTKPSRYWQPDPEDIEEL